MSETEERDLIAEANAPVLYKRAGWTVKKYAEELGISQRTIWMLIKEGRLRTVNVGKRRVLIPGDEGYRFAREGL